MKASGMACKVFLALKKYSNQDGYCWPFVSTIQEDIAISTESRSSIFRALKELKQLGVIDSRQLISRAGGGRNSPSLYRIGSKIEKLPQNAQSRYVLHEATCAKSPRKKESLDRRGPQGDTSGRGPQGDTTPVAPGGRPPYLPEDDPRPPLDTQKYLCEGSEESQKNEGSVIECPVAEDVSPNTEAQNDSASENAFSKFGFDSPFGHAKFREAVLRKSADVKNGNILAVMESVIVELKEKVPPMWYERKHFLERPSIDSSDESPRLYPFSADELRSHRATVLSQFEKTMARYPAIDSELRAIANTFHERLSIACDLFPNCDFEKLERDLAGFDDMVFHLLSSRATPETIALIRREVTFELSPKRDSLSEDRYKYLERHLFHQRLVRAFCLKRMSLFYYCESGTTVN